MSYDAYDDDNEPTYCKACGEECDWRATYCEECTADGADQRPSERHSYVGNASVSVGGEEE